MNFDEIKKIVSEEIGKENIDKITLEASTIVIYVNNKDLFLKGFEVGSNLAKKYKKRFNIRLSPKLLDNEENIRNIVEEILNKYNIKYRRILLERHRSIIVIDTPDTENIGQEIINIIRERTYCNVLIKRSPLKTSKIIDSVRIYIHKNSKYRSIFLNDVGLKILEKKPEKLGFYRIAFLGAGREVGRSSIFLQTKESNILIDFGLGVGNYNENMFPFLKIPELNLLDIDAVVISHAHLDHIGFLPYLFRIGWKGPVYLTEATRDIGALVMLDYIKVSSKQQREPVYNIRDVRMFLKNSITVEYNEVTDITSDVKITLTNANHILGSSMVHINIENKHNILYTGDFKYNQTKLFNRPQTRFTRIETLIIESTYGGPNDIHPPRDENEREFINDIKQTIENGGKVLIPSLAIGRAQDVLLVLIDAIKNKILPEVNIYLDGIIWETTMIHTAYPHILNDNLKNMILSENDPFEQEFIIKVSNKERDSVIEEKDPSIIIATSGMMQGGPIIEYFKHMAENEKNLLALVSYQAEGTLGRRLLEGEREIMIDDKKVNVKLNIKKYSGFSGHADIKEISSFIRNLKPKPKQAFVVHGEESKTKNVAYMISKRFNIHSYNPRVGDVLRLD